MIVTYRRKAWISLAQRGGDGSLSFDEIEVKFDSYGTYKEQFWDFQKWTFEEFYPGLTEIQVDLGRRIPVDSKELH